MYDYHNCDDDNGNNNNNNNNDNHHHHHHHHHHWKNFPMAFSCIAPYSAFLASSACRCLHCCIMKTICIVQIA